MSENRIFCSLCKKAFTASGVWFDVVLCVLAAGDVTFGFASAGVLVAAGFTVGFNVGFAVCGVEWMLITSEPILMSFADIAAEAAAAFSNVTVAVVVVLEQRFYCVNTSYPMDRLSIGWGINL